jgi:hypothetical protein
MPKPRAQRNSTSSKKKGTPTSTQLRWSDHPEWDERLVAALQENDTKRRALFAGDSLTKAKEEGRNLKNSTKLTRAAVLNYLCDKIFKDDANVGEEYKTKPSRFSPSLRNHISRY